MLQNHEEKLLKSKNGYGSVDIEARDMNSSLLIPSSPLEFEYKPLPMEVEASRSRADSVTSISTSSSSDNPYARYQLMIIFAVTCCLGPLNFVLYKVSYAAFGKGNEFFVSNMVNLQYVVFGQLVLWYAYYDNQVDEDTLTNPSLHGKIQIMAFLDAFSGFLAAMGAVHTSGAIQQLLNQTLIPCTM
jgi:hypothetical protein